MYPIGNLSDLLKLRGKEAPVRPGAPGVSRNVLFLGLTSLFTDVSSEMVSTVLPVYLVFFLRLSPLQYGAVDGLYQGVAALVRVAGGLLADRWRRYKEVAAAGYALSAVCKLGLLAAGGAWGAVAGTVLLDRLGKGIRTAPRDALISLSSTRAGLASAFGVHRALDTAGAMLGPLVAFGVLSVAPNAFDAVFVASFGAAIVGLGVLVLFVENRPLAQEVASGSAETARAALRLFAGPRFRALTLAGTLLGLVTVSDGFLYLILQRRLSFGVGFFPLLYVGTALSYFLFSVPAGRLADRVGRAPVFVFGYALLLVVYALVVLPLGGDPVQLICLVILGAHYAATDGVLMALTSATVPPASRASGLALLTSATSGARLFASVAFGAAWTWWGMEWSLRIFGWGLLAALVVAGVLLARTGEDRDVGRRGTN